MAVELLLAFGIHMSDETRLDRVVPYLISLLTDDTSIVRVTTLKALTQLLSLTDTLTPGDANIFPEYVLPSLQGLSSDPDVFVRSTYAQCIASIGSCSETQMSN